MAPVKGANGANSATGGSKHCFEPGSYFTFKIGTDGTPTAAKNAFAYADTYCGADGKSAPGTLVTAGQAVWTVAGTDYSTTATYQAKVEDGTAANNEGFYIKTTAPTCTCGTSTMPTDGCASLTSTDVSTKCITTKESSAAGAALCCLATFDTAPLVKKAGVKVESATLGAEVKSDKFYACYKKTSGKFRFKTASGATPASKSGWVSADAFCANDKVGKDVTDVAFTHTVETAVATGSDNGLFGKATSCVCGAAGIF